MKYTFKGGVHPLTNKVQVENKNIDEFPASKHVYIPLHQNIGQPLEAIVKINDFVKLGEKLGESSSPMSVPVHSSVSGKILKFELLDGIETVTIENDFKDDEFLYTPLVNYKESSREELIKIVRERGIVGLGGAAFPTHIKLNPPPESKITTLIINAAECEPYLNNDNILMKENPRDIIEGAKILQYIVGAEKIIVGIEENKPLAIESIKTAITQETNISIAILKTKYPQGGEKQLIKTITGIELPIGKLPSFVGIVVSNVQTIKAVFDGIIKGKALTKRLITVSGGGVKEPKNLLVRVGTLFSEILDYSGFDPSKTERLVVGGPLMGFAQDSTEHVVVKGTTGLLALTSKELRRTEQENCISCSKCVDVCPMKLMPLIFERNFITNKLEKNIEYNLIDCIECGACTYICPANRPLNEAIRAGKIELRNKK